ncbi:MAG: ABC transporter ATP-binding protein [Halioglobus sp.]|nr:ABC transporter ATP-binding protein [Halioglobus sp.]
MTATVIKVDKLSKYYRLGLIGGNTLREDINRWMARLQGKPDPLLKIGQAASGHRKGDEIWALKAVDFEVKQGEILGIIGRNGAGKSTLLKILSRITAPSEGRITLRGRVGSLLEVGTGFHPELTGRENIYLNGTILGMKKLEVDRKLEEIVEFAEMGKFIDTPVKRYSSGMTVRLAFAVAAHLEPEILVIDEVLAVGDAAFQKKCIGKMQDIAGGGRTVLFVTHNMGTAADLCDRGLVIADGRVSYDGGIEDAIREYLRPSTTQKLVLGKQYFRGHLLDEISVKTLAVNGIDLGQQILITPESELVFEFSGTSTIALKDFDLLVTLHKDGVRVVTVHDSAPGTPLREGEFRSRISIPAHTLRPGTYTVGLGGERPGGGQWFAGTDLGEITILEGWSSGYERRSVGVINISSVGQRHMENDPQR